MSDSSLRDHATAGKMRIVHHHRHFLVWGVLIFCSSLAALLYPMWVRGNSPAFTQWNFPTANAYLHGIATGPDQDLWTTEYEASKIAKFNPTTQQFTEYNVPQVPGTSGTMAPSSITKGPDNNMWFVDHLSHTIAKVTTGGSFSQYTLSLSQFQLPENIVAVGSDIWFSSFQGPYDLGEMDTNGNLLHTYIPDPLTGNIAKGIEGMSLGPDGNLWFAESQEHAIGEFNLTTLAYTEYPISGEAYWTAPGPDGDVWFGEADQVAHIEKINPTTDQISSYSIPFGSIPGQIVSGPGGKIYFAERGSPPSGPIKGIGIIDPTTGQVSEYSTPPNPANGAIGEPTFITIGPDGNIWYADDYPDLIGVMNGISSTSTPTPTPTRTPTPTATPSPSSTVSPSPTPSGSPGAGRPPVKIGICHATGSSTHPYQYIVVDQSAEQAFLKDPNDIFGVNSAADCPSTLITVDPNTPLLNSDPEYVTDLGSKHSLIAGQAVAFFVDKSKGSGIEHHTATVKDVGSNFADLVVQSNPIQVHLTLGQTKTVDVDSSGQPPISVELASVSGSNAVLIFRALASTVQSPMQPKALSGTKGTNTGWLGKWRFAAAAGLVVGAILILIAFVMIYLKRKQMPFTNGPTPPADAPPAPPAN